MWQEAVLRVPARTEAHCRATRTDGLPCQSTILTSSGLCGAHEPSLAVRRASARRRGGRNSRKIRRMRSLVPPRLVDVYEQLELALTAVHAGELPPPRAAAMANLARAMVTVLQAGELEERVRTIEESMT